MIETLSEVLPVIIYSLLIVFLIVVIILGIKVIIIVDSINNIIQDIQNKVASLDGIFRFASSAANKLNSLGSKIVDTVVGSITKIIGGKGKDDDYV